MRARKRHIQLETPKVDKNEQHRGGRRKGAGRPPKGARAGSPHKRRAALNPRNPQHVTLRVVPAVHGLRKQRAYRALRTALGLIRKHDNFRIVHVSVQSTHVHLLCEASDRIALSRGLQGFQISAARHLNRVARRHGQVFADRYHATPISSVRQARHALAYVLNNWRRHREDCRTAGLYDGKLDPFSSGVWFPGWRERTVAEVHVPHGYDPPAVCRPHTWLLAEGWKRAAPISVFEVPGPN